ncbi:DUF3784 domain-containing protein [Bacillus sp. DTU_2020_1000418_1_SI_GHA_SEK_038]|uniref:DUF3784 domain-containing protein n=1 Tax=Bacillus sp. DTU_2020_1000418_1_SI_GHA_SEK_038 TaxID=3077585 RepID=UPI0028ED4DBF|nr:DUF3784 domain-containing protein [Bacillus sp. DTU_2020_1000418_1_SI_GHA_SEK_038]WNS76313.1 DUF3784 domain-containing protein [Bacillus sp. DTU_2020_1000418_1_SI_GHA_SEK_038]
MWGLFISQLMIGLLFLVLGWAVRYKKAYFLISGFSSRSETEKQQLIANGYPQKIGNLLLVTAVVMIIMLPLSFSSFTYSMEVQFGVILVLLMGGLIYLSKFDIPSKRKRSYIISTILFIVVIGTITTLSVFSYQGYELSVKENSFEITGMYGDEWPIDGIIHVELLEVMPDITVRTNGIGMPTLSKGHFKVKDYGSSLLFIQKGASPYVYIELEKRKIFINDKDPSKTILWYEKLRDKTRSTK